MSLREEQRIVDLFEYTHNGIRILFKQKEITRRFWFGIKETKEFGPYLGYVELPSGLYSDEEIRNMSKHYSDDRMYPIGNDMYGSVFTIFYDTNPKDTTRDVRSKANEAHTLSKAIESMNQLVDEIKGRDWHTSEATKSPRSEATL